MKIVSWFSAGITSTVATKMAINKYGKESVDIYYFDTGSAHEDNKRFITECEEWFGVKIKTVQALYKNHWDVIKKTRYINGAAGARCTGELKKNMRYYIMKHEKFDHHIMGYEWGNVKELNRAIRFAEQYPETNPIFPLIDKKLTKQNCLEIVKRAGIKPPIMYQQGFNNNNCIGCPKGGMGYWAKIKENYPDAFKEMAEIERDIGATCITKKVWGINEEGKKVCTGRERVWLDELDTEKARKLKPVVPACGTICEVEFAELIDKRVELILTGQLSMEEIWRS